jgi:hypothetical protein
MGVIELVDEAVDSDDRGLGFATVASFFWVIKALAEGPERAEEFVLHLNKYARKRRREQKQERSR